MHFDSGQKKYVIDFANGISFTFPPLLVPELKDATREQLADVKILGADFTIEWTKLDQDFGVKGFIQEFLNLC